MERRNRNLLVICVAAVIVIAVFSSFGLNLFAPGTAQITLPTPTTSGNPGDNPGGGEHSGLVRVEVTPQTVQGVIETLARPDSYYREVTVEDHWGTEGSGVTTAKVWVDDGWTKAEAVLPGGTGRNSVVGDGAFWIWYGSGRDVLQGRSDESSADLEGQRIPTYEDVLALDQQKIAAAGDEMKGGLYCIYVETALDELGYHDRYWISVESGLLVAAETLSGEQTVYSMSAYTVERPVPPGTLFTLPDGTVLHMVH